MTSSSSSQSVPAVTPAGGVSSPQSSPSTSFMQALTPSLGAAPGKVEAAHIASVPDLRIADYTDNVDVTPGMDYQDVLVVAMKREEKAHNLYTALASNTSDGGLKKLFELLAHEEARHKLALEKEYDDHVLSSN